MAYKTLTELQALARKHAVGSSTDTTWNETDLNLTLNQAYQDLFLIANEAQGDNEIQGDGSQTINITAGTRKYPISSYSIFRLSRVEIKYPSSASDYALATQIDPKSIDTGKDNYAPPSPEFDLLSMDYLDIFVPAKTASIEAVASGIKVYFQTDLTELVSGASIIFPNALANYVAQRAAEIYLTERENYRKATAIGNMRKEAHTAALKYFVSRSTAKRIGMRMRNEDYGQSDLGNGGRPSVDWN